MKLLSIEVNTQDCGVFLNFLKSIANAPNLAIEEINLKFYGLKVKLSDLLTVYPLKTSRSTKLTVN